jgi:hypothetical protein
MPLYVPDPPAQGMDIIRDALSSAAAQPSVAASVVAEAGPQNLTTAAPHQVYFVGLSDLAEGRLLSAAQLKGWHYIIFEGDRTLATAELRIGDGDALHFSNVNRGPFAASIVEGVGRVESLDEVRDDDFELRVLDIPGLYVVALWLHGPREIIVPLPPAPEALEPFGRYEENAIIERLRGRAEQRLQFDDRPIKGSR